MMSWVDILRNVPGTASQIASKLGIPEQKVLDEIMEGEKKDMFLVSRHMAGWSVIASCIGEAYMVSNGFAVPTAEVIDKDSFFAERKPWMAALCAASSSRNCSGIAYCSARKSRPWDATAACSSIARRGYGGR